MASRNLPSLPDPPADYRGHDNETKGWTVMLSSGGRDHARHFALLGDARRAAFKDACWSDTERVRVSPSDCPWIVVCGFRQPDGLWRDQCSDIRAFEAWQDRADLSAHLISDIEALDDRARRLILHGVGVGGVVAHTLRHRGCLLAQSEGLIALAGTWVVTSQGRRFLEQFHERSGALPA